MSAKGSKVVKVSGLPGGLGEYCLPVCDGFPAAEWANGRDLLWSRLNEKSSKYSGRSSLRECLSAWDGLLLRIIQFDQAAAELTTAIVEAQDVVADRMREIGSARGPASDLLAFTGAQLLWIQAVTSLGMPRYKIESALLEMYVAGTSIFETFAYAMYALGAVVKPKGFAFTLPVHNENVSIGNTADLWQKRSDFNQLAAATTLSGLQAELKTDGSLLADWRVRRNVLAHRAVSSLHGSGDLSQTQVAVHPDGGPLHGTPEINVIFDAMGSPLTAESVQKQLDWLLPRAFGLVTDGSDAISALL
jgi:hypothetical protein